MKFIWIGVGSKFKYFSDNNNNNNEVNWFFAFRFDRFTWVAVYLTICWLLLQKTDIVLNMVLMSLLWPLSPPLPYPRCWHRTHSPFRYMYVCFYCLIESSWVGLPLGWVCVRASIRVRFFFSAISRYSSFRAYRIETAKYFVPYGLKIPYSFPAWLLPPPSSFCGSSSSSSDLCQYL